MGTRRSHLLVLLLVLGLVIVSGIVIASKETKLGLDLQGGLELVYQGQPTGTATEVSGEDIDDSISIIEQRINKLGVSEPEVARLGADQITVSLPGVTDANRAAEQVGHHRPALLLRLGAEPDRAREGDRRQTRRGTAGKSDQRIGKTLGRSRPQRQQKRSEQRLIVAGAYPTAYEAVKLASEQEPVEDCQQQAARSPDPATTSSTRTIRTMLIAGPELAEKDLYVSPTGEKRPKGRDRPRGAAGNGGGLGTAGRRSGPGDRRRRAGLVRAQRRTGPQRQRHHRPRTDLRPDQPTGRQLQFHRLRPEAFQEVTRQIAQRGQARRSARSAPKKPKPSPATSPSSSTTKSKRGRSSTSPKTPTGSTVAPGPRSAAASTASTRPRNWRPPCRSAPCRSTSN